jgi:hypothetical protein
MKVKLPEIIVRRLVTYQSLAEFKKLCQRVTVVFIDGERLETFAYNSELVDLPDDIRYVKEIKDAEIR